MHSSAYIENLCSVGAGLYWKTFCYLNLQIVPVVLLLEWQFCILCICILRTEEQKNLTGKYN